MIAESARERFVTLAQKVGVEDYNFEHFRPKHLFEDVQRTLDKVGILPGEPAPDFELPRVGGDSISLRDLRDRPVLLHFGSLT